MSENSAPAAPAPVAQNPQHDPLFWVTMPACVEPDGCGAAAGQPCAEYCGATAACDPPN